ncbi:hypothetical protein [Natronosalvus amylolyticus]|uniref:hypothetical protein n=1 Tax=Natronosalvus amylolyticus TaxID=2961994 RepID=UPI0020C9DBBD|nr:hypothetical protein [Natronosalvus amylolyticus]
MKRRTVLLALGSASALAGCLAENGGAGGNGDAGDDNENDDDGTANGTNGAGENDGEHDDGSVVDSFDGELSRPDCSVDAETIEIEVEHDDEPLTYRTAATKPYPDPPDSLDEDTILEYLDAFEHAYVSKEVLCGRNGSGHILTIAYSRQERKVFDWETPGTTIFLLRAAGATRGIEDSGGEWAAELGFHGVVYTVDETGVARADFDGAGGLEADELESKAPNPLEDGELVARFG